METPAEVDRLREVYRHYAAVGFGESKWSSANRGNQAIQSERERGCYKLLRRSGFIPLRDRRILDVGCGTGEQLGTLLRWGAREENLFGIDLIPDRIKTARQKFPRVTFQLANAESLPFLGDTLDLVMVFTVFTSILDRQMAANVCGEINRVLVRGGAVLWYDFRMNNPFNRHVRGVSRRTVQSLFPGYRLTLESITLLPPLARRLGRLTGLLYRPLSALPCLRSHYAGLFTKV